MAKQTLSGAELERRRQFAYHDGRADAYATAARDMLNLAGERYRDHKDAEAEVLRAAGDHFNRLANMARDTRQQYSQSEP